MYRIKFFALKALILTSFLSTAQPKKVILEQIKPDTNISGLKVIRFPDLWRDFSKDEILAESTSASSLGEDMTYVLSKPLWLSIQTIGWDAYVYSQPGDIIKYQFTILDGKRTIKFHGKNAAYYNYNFELKQAISKNEELRNMGFNETEDLNTYLLKINSWLSTSNSFLMSYSLKNSLKKDFINYCKDELIYEYVYKLYDPLINHKIPSNKIPTNYFDILQGKFDRRISHISYGALLAYTYKNILCYKQDPYNYLGELKKNINRDFSGVFNDYLTAQLIGVFSKKQLPKYKDTLLAIIKAAKKQVKDSTCLDYIQRCELDYEMLDHTLPMNVLNNTFIEEYGTSKKITLNQLLEKYPGKPLYIDFWANWCGACRMDIAESTEARKYMQSLDVIYIFLSIDKDQDVTKWRKAAKEDKITDNQYRLIDGTQSFLGLAIKLSSIPRYL